VICIAKQILKNLFTYQVQKLVLISATVQKLQRCKYAGEVIYPSCLLRRPNFVADSRVNNENKKFHAGKYLKKIS